jgi:hypothetical protein
MTVAEAIPGLSRDQTMILLGQALTPGLPTYSTPVVYAIGGDVEPDRFQLAFRTALGRAPILRQRFRLPTGLLDEACEDAAVVVVTGPGPTPRSRAGTPRPVVDPARRCWHSELDTSPAGSRWLVDFHQIVADQWSVRQFFTEVSALYTAREAPPRMSGATLDQICDDPGTVSRDRAYWMRWLKHEFVADQTSPIRGAARCRLYSVEITGHRYASLLRLFARGTDLPPALGQLSIWLSVIAEWHRLAAPDLAWLCAAVTWHNRSPAVAHLIGPFMRTTPVQIPLAASGRETRRGIDQSLMLGLAHRHYTIPNPPQRPVYDCLVTLAAEPEPTSFAGRPTRMEFASPGYLFGRQNIQIVPTVDGYRMTISQVCGDPVPALDDARLDAALEAVHDQVHDG